MTEITAINPATGARLPGPASTSIAEALSRTARAAEVQRKWAAMSFAERASRLLEMAQRLRDEAEKHAAIMTREMGKPVSSARKEVEKCAWVCEFYAEHGESFLSPQSIESDAEHSYVCFPPLGVVLAVMPWNFPYWQVFRFAAPALMAGNGAILKHASNVPGCALAIEQLFRDAGFPEGLFATVLIAGKDVAELITSPDIAAVTLTGSTPAGSAVAAEAGRQLKKSVLELGGSDPYVVLEDADLPKAADACVASRLVNTGQSCIAAKRFIVVEAVQQAFQDCVLERLRQVTWGDPQSPETELGPMAREDLRDELHEQVRRSIAAGARCLLGGEVPDRSGAWYPPTLLVDVTPGMPAFDEELFGPVAVIVPARDCAHALQLANQSDYGLGAAVFTANIEQGKKIAEQSLEAGFCAVNDFVRSDPRLPFGGIKRSGYGRELSSFGIREFVNTKTVYIA